MILYSLNERIASSENIQQSQALQEVVLTLGTINTNPGSLSAMSLFDDGETNTTLGTNPFRNIGGGGGNSVAGRGGSRNNSGGWGSSNRPGLTSVPRTNTSVHWGQQGKHIPGHNNFTPGRSIVTADPRSLINTYAGTGQAINNIPRGQPGFKERINFGHNIGYYKDGPNAPAVPTSNGILHYSQRGIHLVPARP